MATDIIYNLLINVRENRKGIQEWTTQRYWQHWVHKTQYEDKQDKIQHRKLKSRPTQTPPKTRGESICSRSVISSYFL